LSHIEKCRDYYGTLLRQHPDDPCKAVDGSPGGLAVRHKLLADTIRQTDSRTVLDVGCGLGAFSPRCWGRDYTGIDIVPEMVAAASAKHSFLEFLECNILTPPGLGWRCFDAVVASGIFQLDTGPDYAPAMIAAMWGYANKVVAFNMLSTGTEDAKKETYEAFYDMDAIVRLCRTFTPFVKADHSYRRNDFTVSMYREQQDV